MLPTDWKLTDKQTDARIFLSLDTFASAFQLRVWRRVKDQYFSLPVWQVYTAGESGWKKPLVSAKPLRGNTYALDYNCWGYLPAVTTQATGSRAWNQDMFNSCQRQQRTRDVHLYQRNSQCLLEKDCVCVMFTSMQWCVSVRLSSCVCDCLPLCVCVGERETETDPRKWCCPCMRKHSQSITLHVDIIRVKQE